MKKKFIALIAAVILFSVCLSVPAFAWDVRANPVISYTNAYITDHGNGNIKITFIVIAKDICSTIGATQIDLYTSDGAFKKTFYSSAYVTMLTHNCGSYTGDVDYPGNVGETYYADVYFYAVCDGVTGTYTHTTPIGP